MKIKRKINIKTLKAYKQYTLGEKLELIIAPKINFEIDSLCETIRTFRLTCESSAIEHIAINCAISNFRAYCNFKQLLRETFRSSQISVNMFTGTQMEITDVNDINEILGVYHSSILGGHRGFERMHNTIKKHYTWPSMTVDIKRFIQNCATCEKTKINRHTHTPLQITSVASAPFEKILLISLEKSIHTRQKDINTYCLYHAT